MALSNEDKTEINGLITNALKALPKAPSLTADDVATIVKAELAKLPAPSAGLLPKDIYDIVEAAVSGRGLTAPNAGVAALTDDQKATALKLAPVLYPDHSGWKVAPDGDTLKAVTVRKQSASFDIRMVLAKAGKAGLVSPAAKLAVSA